MPELSFLRDLLVLFGLGVGVVLAFSRLRLPPIIGFLITGVVAGPYGFGLIRGIHEVEALAEIGVLLLLFTIGIEISVQHLVRIRRFFAVGGVLQVSLTVLGTLAITMALGLEWRVAAFIGMLVALSSTAIVLRLLTDRGEMDTPHGRMALGVLIFQDLCIVPMVLATPFLAGQGNDLASVVLIIGKALLFLLAAVGAAKFVVPWLLALVVRTRKREVFLLAILLICLGTAWASSQVGLSLALGAFIAGLMLSESEFNHQALGEILPLREVFNSLFFISIGMLFDVRTVLREPDVILGTLSAVLVLKAVVSSGVAWLLGQPLRVALIAGLAISQIGEFSFVLSKVGLRAGLIDGAYYQLFLAVTVGSMALTPLLTGVAPRLADTLHRFVPPWIAAGRALPRTEPVPALASLVDHVIVIGFGMNGRNLARVLEHVGVEFVAIDMNPDTVRNERDKGIPILYGDATRREILEHAGIRGARVLVIAISDIGASRAAADLARRLNPSLYVIVRSRYVQEMAALYAVGANEVVPEEFETSIEIFSRVLRQYFFPQDIIESRIADIRKGSYDMLRSLAMTHRPAIGLERYMGDLSLAVYRIEANSALIGRTLAESGIRPASGATVAAIQKVTGETVVNPQGSALIYEGDVVLVLGSPHQLSLAEPLFRTAGSQARGGGVPQDPARSTSGR